MLLIPMDGPNSIPCIVRCKNCSKHVHSSEANADIKGEPFKAFYCKACTDFTKFMTREEFFAKVENAHV
jgi:hypothetical protein